MNGTVAMVCIMGAIILAIWHVYKPHAVSPIVLGDWTVAVRAALHLTVCCVICAVLQLLPMHSCARLWMYMGPCWGSEHGPFAVINLALLSMWRLLL